MSNKEPYETIRAIPCVNALWADHAHSESYHKMKEINDKLSDFNFTGPYFGGVAFKYTRQVDLTGDKLVSAIEEAKPYVNIITTSGEATGSAPNVDKIKLFREVLGEDHALAIASGITVDNVESFLPYADCFLVASGIEKEFGILDPVKTNALAYRIYNY